MIKGIEDHGAYIWKSITEGPYMFSKTKEYVYNNKDYDIVIEKYNDITKEKKEKLQNDLKAKRDLRFTLAPSTFWLISSLKMVNEI